MSNETTDQYPEVSGDESGLVPPQDYKGEWPKKIRTLSANELDRLTIDSAGRFYWDGHLVNYQPPQPQQAPDVNTADADERNALEMLDRAALELTPAGALAAAPPHPVHAQASVAPQVEIRAVDLDTLAAPPAPVVPVVAPPVPAQSVVAAADIRPADYPTLIAPAVRGSADRVQLSFSRWQSFGIVLAVLGLVIGASGVAAYGWTAAHEWGCRTGMVSKYCPLAPAAKPQPGSDIPA